MRNPRGIEPDNLLGLVRNTAPFIFSNANPPPYIKTLQDYAGQELDHVGYFRLCLSAHWATAGTYVPTDVDNAIRLKLWEMNQPPEVLSAMSSVVLEALRWDFQPVTARLARSGSDFVSTHEGTWFSVAAGAYAALRDLDKPKAGEVLEAILGEAGREAALFKKLWEDGPELELLKACALLAHNFGDLDRVIDDWKLPEDDNLRRALYDAAAPGSTLFDGLLAQCGRINQRHLAPENHRHFALRAPRCLRRKAELLIPVGPFYDDWGRRVAAENSSDAAEVVRALIDGWQYLDGPVGYARALAGILEFFPGGLSRLSGLLPSKDARILKSGPLKNLIDVPRTRFEAQWANFARKAKPLYSPAAPR